MARCAPSCPTARSISSSPTATRHCASPRLRSPTEAEFVGGARRPHHPPRRPVAQEPDRGCRRDRRRIGQQLGARRPVAAGPQAPQASTGSARPTVSTCRKTAMSRSERWEVGERPSLDIRVPVGTIEVFAATPGDRATDDRRRRRRRVRGLQDRRSDLGASSVAVGQARTQQPHRCSRARGDRRRAQLDIWRGAPRRSARRRAGAHRVAATSRSATRSRLDITTTSGELSCGDIAGDAHVSSVSGDCTHAPRRRQRSTRRSPPATFASTCATETCHVVLDQWRCAHRLLRRQRHRRAFDLRRRSGRAAQRASASMPRSRRSAVGQRCRSRRRAAETGDRRPVRLQLKTVSGDIRVERTD